MSRISKYNTYDQFKAIHRSKVGTDGSIDHIFTDKFVSILDESIVTDNRYVFSIEQQNLIDKYYEEAEQVTNNTGVFSDTVSQLDIFLGNYKEEKVK